MRPLNLLVISLLLSLLSCRKERVEPINTTTTVKTEWETGNLNSDYTFQFPADTYDGAGYQLRSATSFGDKPTSINRKDQRASLSATFCDPNAYPCFLIQYYGEGLATPLPDAVPYRNSKGEDAFLNQRVTFGKDGKLFAVFYYGIEPALTLRPYVGRLYTVSRETGTPRYTGNAEFNEATKQELLDILATIAPKQ